MRVLEAAVEVDPPNVGCVLVAVGSASRVDWVAREVALLKIAVTTLHRKFPTRDKAPVLASRYLDMKLAKNMATKVVAPAVPAWLMG